MKVLFLQISRGEIRTILPLACCLTSVAQEPAGLRSASGAKSEDQREMENQCRLHPALAPDFDSPGTDGHRHRLGLRRAILANLPDMGYIGNTAYWAKP